MIRLTAENIERLLQERLKKTVDMSKSLDMSDTDSYNIIYFRLYFDFSTAIESTIGNILYLKYEDDAFIFRKSKIDSEVVSKYIPKDEIKLLLKDYEYTITVQEVKEQFLELNCLIKESFFMNLGLTKRLDEVEEFNSFYSKSRDTRNKLAHGLVLENVNFDNNTLFKFMASYCVVKKYYETISS